MADWVDVNPAILSWARERARLNLSEAAEKFGIRRDRLEKIEHGDESARVSRSLFEKLIRVYRQPPLAFYLSRPPKTEDYGVEFRRIREDLSPTISTNLEALIRNVYARQSILRSAIELEEEAYNLPFIGSPSSGRRIQHAIQKLTSCIGGSQVIDVSRTKSSSRESFKVIREGVENSGVFVIFKGNLGSYHTEIPVKAFQGMVITDEIAPFIIINPNDSYPARTFTLLHEMVHLLLGRNNVSGGRFEDGKIERFCNQVASECLLSDEMLDDLRLPETQSLEGSLQLITEFASRWNLSGTMVAYRLLLAERISKPEFTRLREEFYRLWKMHRRRRRISGKHSSHPPYAMLQRNRVGNHLCKITNQLLETNAISTSRAARILGIRPLNVEKVLYSETGKRI